MNYIPTNHMMSLLEYTEAKKRNDPIPKAKTYSFTRTNNNSSYRMMMNPERLLPIIKKAVREINNKNMKRGIRK